jgi:hypothetical protein
MRRARERMAASQTGCRKPLRAARRLAPRVHCPAGDSPAVPRLLEIPARRAIDSLEGLHSMLTKTTHLNGFVIRAKDGEIGTVDQFYFDDETWAIRYLTVETGGWLGGRKVLISPISVSKADWQAKRLDVSLTMKQVEHSPDIYTHQPVSRQHEAAYLNYYGYQSYWGGPNEWGPALYPEGLARRDDASASELADMLRRESPDSHLRSAEAVTGYNIEAVDGEIGHVDGFIVDDRTWTIRYIEVATRNWMPGKKVLVSPTWIERVSWADSKVFVALTRESIQSAPAYDDSMPIPREYENRLYAHYGRPPYWLRGATSAFAGA